MWIVAGAVWGLAISVSLAPMFRSANTHAHEFGYLLMLIFAIIFVVTVFTKMTGLAAVFVIPIGALTFSFGFWITKKKLGNSWLKKAFTPDGQGQGSSTPMVIQREADQC